jgi:hypothetical protein
MPTTTRVMAWVLVIATAIAFSTSHKGHADEDNAIAYRLGEIAAYAKQCGYHSDVTWLNSKFGDYPDFKDGQKQTLARFAIYDFVHISCGRVRDLVEDLRSAAS